MSKGRLRPLIGSRLSTSNTPVVSVSASFSIEPAGIKSTGADKSEDFNTTKNIKSVYMKARATGEFTRQELTKAGNVTELPKNFVDYKEPEDEDEEGGEG